MGIWTDSVERKAAIIHSQFAEALKLAAANSAPAESVAAPYLKLLRTLYADEFPFARLTDTSDLVARFRGPAVDIHDPTVSIVISVFTDIREQIRGIAKSIAGLTSETRMLWPAQLDPHLSGIAHGSLLVGISVAPPENAALPGEQIQIAGVSEQVFLSIRSAVRSLSQIAKYVSNTGIDESIRDAFPDPAVRDTVLVAARRLAPTGKRGIDSVSFYTSDAVEGTVSQLTPSTRRALSSALATPIRTRGEGSFEGLIREIDLDARRFEIRGVNQIGAIRCVYGAHHDDLVRGALDARVRVAGKFEALESSAPRLVYVNTLAVLAPPPIQLSIPH